MKIIKNTYKDDMEHELVAGEDNKMIEVYCPYCFKIKEFKFVEEKDEHN